MATMISAKATVDGVEYRITRMTDGDAVEIDRRDSGRWVQIGRGRRNDAGAIYDCAATIPETAYEALESELTAAIDAQP